MTAPSAPVAADRASGLSAAEADERLEADGPNALPGVPRPPAWRALLGQMVHFFALMLWVAAGLAVVADLPQLSVAIVVVIVVNGVFAFVQEERAERAAERLRALLPADVVVRRDGSPRTVHAAELVVGDLVQLDAGDRVPADLRVLDASSLQVDESTLTGESTVVAKGDGADLWAGTFAVTGEALAEVTATGGRTRLAGIAALTGQVDRPKSPLATELDRIVRTMATVTVGLGLAFFVITLLVGTSLTNSFVFAIGVTVALVPEGLLPTVTLSLAMGAQRMAGRRALVRHLEAVETLGSVTFICTDKTGTLTTNQMSVVDVWTPSGRVHLDGTGYEPTATASGDPSAIADARALAADARACSQGEVREVDGGWVAVGDPMEAAIDALRRRLEVPDAPDPPLALFAFDTERKRQSALLSDRLVVKGAPDSVLPRCLPTAATEAAEAATEELAARGLRVLAVARRVLGPAEVSQAVDGVDADADELERDLGLLGLIGLHDPPRPRIAESLAACRSAGIKVGMLTGDHPATARAIAEEIGLLGPAGIVLRADAMPADDGHLGALLDHDGVVISRVSPEDKLRITRVLQGRGHVVAMTGDGVNDGPALSEADIGVAMGRSGTDVAREAADLVLLDDDFATIVAAVEHGRATFANIRRFLTYHLTDNVAELTPFVIWALSGGRFPLALSVMQVLAIDIATDLLPALALGAEPPRPGILARPLTGRHVIDGSLLRRVFGVLGPTEAAVEMAAFLAVVLSVGWLPGDAFPGGDELRMASGAAFAAVVLGQMANAMACRSTAVPPWKLGWTSNRLILGALVVQGLLLALLLAWGPAADLLDHLVPPAAGWAVAVLAIPTLLAVDAAHKALLHRRRVRTGR